MTMIWSCSGVTSVGEIATLKNELAPVSATIPAITAVGTSPMLHVPEWEELAGVLLEKLATAKIVSTNARTLVSNSIGFILGVSFHYSVINNFRTSFESGIVGAPD
ncbi:MAG: hypothetical protein ACI9J2_000669 [Saprospiraceae bacterium]|jgi:hypothetical protein